MSTATAHDLAKGRTLRSLRLGALALALASLLVVSLVACGTPAIDDLDDIPDITFELWHEMTVGEDAELLDTSEFATDKEDLLIGYAGQGLHNNWQVQAMGTAEIIAEEIGVELAILQAEGDATKQISDVEDLLARGVDAIVIQPVAPDPVAPVIERAHQQGIPVIVWGAEVATDQYTSLVVADDFFFGRMGGEKLVEDLGGEGNIIMLRGLPGNTLEELRYGGAMSAIEESDIVVLGEEYGDWAYAQGKAITESMLAAHDQIDGVWSSGADMTRGAVEAFQEAGRDLVPMSGEHLNGFLKMWAELDMESSAPVFPSWLGAESVKLATLALRGEPIHDRYDVQPDPITDVDAAILPDISDDYWVEGYLTEDQILQIFPR